MKKIILSLLILILTLILASIAVFVFNPLDLRTKIISSLVKEYVNKTVDDYKTSIIESTLPVIETGLDKLSESGSTTEIISPAIETVKKVEKAVTATGSRPLLSEEQIKLLEKYGVSPDSLPTSISPAMEACFIEKLGADRVKEIVNGAAPTMMEIFKAKDCLGK